MCETENYRIELRATLTSLQRLDKFAYTEDEIEDANALSETLKETATSSVSKEPGEVS